MSKWCHTCSCVAAYDGKDCDNNIDDNDSIYNKNKIIDSNQEEKNHHIFSNYKKNNFFLLLFYNTFSFHFLMNQHFYMMM